MGISALFGLLKSKSTSSSSSSHLPSGDRIMEPGRLPLALDSECKSTSPTQTKWSPLQSATSGFHRFFSALTRSNALAPVPCCIEDNESQIEQGKESSLYVYNSPDSAFLKGLQRNNFINILCAISILLAVELHKLATMGLTGVSDVLWTLAYFGYIGSAGVLCALNHKCFRHHVHQLRWQPGSYQFEVDKVSWCIVTITKTVKFSDIRPPQQTDRYYYTFVANGESYCVADLHVFKMLMTGNFPDQFPEVSESVLSEDAAAGHIAS